MKNSITTTLAAVLLVLASAGTGRGAEKTGGLSPETPAAREARMAWWREARFGLFMHWGIYAVPAGEWKGFEGKDLGGEWIMYTAKIPVPQYEQLAKRFNPVKFSAREWVQLAKDTGMKYMVITAKHCDGFAMYHSRVTPYNVVDATPFARDPLEELGRECRREGIPLGFYYSHAWDWHEPDAMGLDNNWSFPDRSKKDADRYLRGKSLPQVAELLTQYRPSVLWFDVPHELLYRQSEDFFRLIRKLHPQCIVNDRIGNGLGDYSTPESYIPAKPPHGDFEVCMPLNEHWGYDKTDPHWKPSPVIIRNLVDIVSKGGNYLLNVGPRADGTFPPEALRILGEVGRWMKTNGESIYGTTAGPLQSLPWGRSTTKAGRLYLHVWDWPADGRLVVPGLKNKIARADLLGGPRGATGRHADQRRRRDAATPRPGPGRGHQRRRPGCGRPAGHRAHAAGLELARSKHGPRRRFRHAPRRQISISGAELQ